MGFGPTDAVSQRLANLEGHLKDENALLVDVVKSFRKLDRIAYRTGLLGRDQSYAIQVPWWPLVSFLGTFSAGKSSFINHYLQYPLQTTGTQAVDDKFTVVCYSSDSEVRELPGIALDSDPRFPFYQMTEELDKVAPGQGEHVDAYLRLKTCPAQGLRGKILIDSPGFDADAQRNATLRITDYIIDLSDLVLVFFDARHPEPGAMQDTLTHLVGNTIKRRDSSKFLYILNQIDTTAREDNPEDVVSSWQRALAQEGLTAGRFYCIYNPELASPIDDPALRERFQTKRDVDLNEIHQRINRVSVERAYRIIGALEKTAREIEEERMPHLRQAMARWARGVWWRDGFMAAGALVLLVAISVVAGMWDGWSFQAPQWLAGLFQTTQGIAYTAVVVLLLAFWAHFTARKRSAKKVLRWIGRNTASALARDQLKHAFIRNTRAWRSVFMKKPAGWGRGTRKRLKGILEEADSHVQRLNDRFTDPSGEIPGASPAAAAPRSEPESEVEAEPKPSPSTESTS